MKGGLVIFLPRSQQYPELARSAAHGNFCPLQLRGDRGSAFARYRQGLQLSVFIWCPGRPCNDGAVNHWPFTSGLCAGGGQRLRLLGGDSETNRTRAISLSPSGSLRRRPNSSWSHAGRDLFDRFTLRMETLRTLNRVRTAATVRLCLSAISVMLFPASTISRSCLSSSGPHGRLGFWAPAIISLPAGGILIAAIE